MKQAFFFYFYKYFHNEYICNLLASIAYMIYCGKFIIKKFFRKKEIVSITKEEAERIIDSVYPRPVSRPLYINPDIDDNIDLSIVIPVYNYAEILDNTIQAILKQNTRYNFEAIFVDDGSTDGARDILKKYESCPNVKLIFQENGGIGAARNTGINNATGKYLMFVDCDDIVHDDIVETLMRRAYEKDLDLVIAAHNLVKEKNGEAYSVMPNVYPQKNLVGYKNGDEIMNYPGLPWAKVYKRELWNKVRFFPGYWYEDTIIQFLIFTQVKSYEYIPKVVYEYKWYEKNFSHTQNNAKEFKCIDSYYLLCEIISRYFSLGNSLDGMFFTVLLQHVSTYYYPFVAKLEKKYVCALFILACDLADKYKVDNIERLPYVINQAKIALEKRDFSLWKIASVFQ